MNIQFERSVTCHEISHDGEGGPGPPIPGLHHPILAVAADYAEQAANLLDEREMREAGTRASDHDGTSRVILVCGLGGDTGPRRFRVRCEVRRKYTAFVDGPPAGKGEPS